MRKVRSDSRLAKLRPAQHAKLLEWLRAGMKYPEVVVLVQEQLGVKTSATAVGNYYATHMEAILRANAPAPSVGICVTVTCHRPGEMLLTFDAPPPAYGPEGETILVTVPATVRSAGVRVVSLTDTKENRIRLVAYPLPPLDAPANNQPETIAR